MPLGKGGQCREQGFAFVVLLAVLAVAAVTLAAVGTLWAEQTRREKELEVLRIGVLYANAISRYHRMSEGPAREYPRNLDELVEDKRGGGLQRHLRRRYADPWDPTRQWSPVVSASGRVIGVFLSSDRVPLKRTEIHLGGVVLQPAATYSDWKFVANIKGRE